MIDFEAQSLIGVIDQVLLHVHNVYPGSQELILVIGEAILGLLELVRSWIVRTNKFNITGVDDPTISRIFRKLSQIIPLDVFIDDFLIDSFIFSVFIFGEIEYKAISVKHDIWKNHRLAIKIYRS